MALHGQRRTLEDAFGETPTVEYPPARRLRHAPHCPMAGSFSRGSCECHLPRNLGDNFDPAGAMPNRARRGEGWHRRGWRNEHGEIWINVTTSPKTCGRYIEIRESANGVEIYRRARGTISPDPYRGQGQMTMVLFHKRKEILATDTAADHELDSGNTLTAKFFDDRGNLLEWAHYTGKYNVYEKGNTFVHEDQHSVLSRYYGVDPWIQRGDARLRQIQRECGLTPARIATWFQFKRVKNPPTAAHPAPARDDSHTLRVQLARARDQAHIAQRRAVFGQRLTNERAAAERNALATQLEQAVEDARAALDIAEREMREAEAQAARTRQAEERAAQIRMEEQRRRSLQQRRRLKVEGECFIVYPRNGTERGRPIALCAGVILDTGNAALTMINSQVATRIGLSSGGNNGYMQVRGVGGLVRRYPIAYVDLKLVNSEGTRCRWTKNRVKVLVDDTSSCKMLVGMDVIAPLFAAGFTLALPNGATDRGAARRTTFEVVQ